MWVRAAAVLIARPTNSVQVGWLSKASEVSSALSGCWKYLGPFRGVVRLVFFMSREAEEKKSQSCHKTSQCEGGGGAGFYF